ncbi:hypothetical protein LguiA_016975 [Lonicera macranthoides]
MMIRCKCLQGDLRLRGRKTKFWGLNFPICVLNEIVMCRQKHSMSKKTSKEIYYTVCNSYLNE